MNEILHNGKHFVFARYADKYSFIFSDKNFSEKIELPAHFPGTSHIIDDYCKQFDMNVTEGAEIIISAFKYVHKNDLHYYELKQDEHKRIKSAIKQITSNQN